MLGKRLVRNLQEKRFQPEVNGIRRLPHFRSRKRTTWIDERVVDVAIRVVYQDEDVVRHHRVEFATLENLLESRDTTMPGPRCHRSSCPSG
jgi:hypothetical protein